MTPGRRTTAGRQGRDGRSADRPDLGGLIELVAAGNRGAFEEFYRRTGAGVYALVRRILPDDLSSARITQDIYVRVWSSAHTYRRALGSAENWLFTLSHRCAVDEVGSSDPQAPPPPVATAPLLPSIAGSSARRALSLLTPEQVEALERAYFGGLGHAEASRALGVDPATFRMRVRTALSRLHMDMDMESSRRSRTPQAEAILREQR
jgi:RNA polymerase sigma-70 factor (ECF subfamily)